MGKDNFRQPSNMDHSFSRSPKVNIPRSVFNRDHAYKTAFVPDYLIPMFAKPMLPGDTINLKSTALIRMPSALIRPFLDNMRLYTYFFWVPNRLVWSNWMKFQGAQTNPGDSTIFSVPKFTAYAPASESLSDYFGIPISGATTPLGTGGTLTHISLPHRMYNLIWNENFRSQDLQNSVTVDLGDGPDSIANYVLLKACKQPDYFTTCLPFTQKGTAQTIPLGTSAPVVYNPSSPNFELFDATSSVSHVMSGSNGSNTAYFNNAAVGTHLLRYNSGLVADLTNASAATVNSFRQSLQIQAIYELDARSGTRYAEACEARFGVNFPDILYRPEFLGGSCIPISVAIVPQTSASNTQPTGLGNLAAYAQAAMHGDTIVKSFVEHGWVIGLMVARADLNYQQGLDRDWLVETRFDYYEPLLQNLGEQAVLNKEIYCQGSANPTDDAAVFGYQERWAHEKYARSQITGKLRSTVATPLDSWHLAEKFLAKPTLGNAFIQCNMPWTRVAAVTSEPAFVIDVYHDFKHVRPMSTYSIPGLLPRF